MVFVYMPGNTSGFFDDYDFLWSRNRRRGYVTLYAEDAPEIAIFNFMKKGFNRPPADYYLRPFSLAIEQVSLRGKLYGSSEHRMCYICSVNH